MNFNTVIYLLLILGVCIDFFSFYLNTKRKLTGAGSTGLPGVSLGIYLLVFLWFDELVFIRRGIDVFLFVFIHFMLQFFMPWLVYYISKIKSFKKN